MSTYPKWPLYQMTEETDLGGIKVRCVTTLPDGLVASNVQICSDLRIIDSTRQAVYEQLRAFVRVQAPELFDSEIDDRAVDDVLHLLKVWHHLPEEALETVRRRLRA